jgi:membrane protein
MTTWRLLKGAVSNWLLHEGPRMAAALSLYTLLSLAPLVILTIAIAAAVFGRPAAQNALLSEVTGLIGSQGAAAVQTVIAHSQAPGGRSWATVLGIATLIFGASSVFGELQSALNKIWEAEVYRRNVLGIVKARLFSFAMVLAVGFISLVSLTVSAAATALSSYYDDLLPQRAPLIHAENVIVSLAIVSVLIAVILKYVPDARVGWRHVWSGAIATAVLFTIGKSLIGLYLGHTAVGSAYGAAGSLVVVIIWVYYSAMIFYLGAEFTRLKADPHRAPG